MELPTNISNLTFPILCIGKNGFLTTVNNRDKLEICGEEAINSGYFLGMILVDSSGKSWEVQSVKKVASGGLFGGWRLFHSRRIRVQLELASKGIFNLTGLQDRVCEAIDHLPAQWDTIEDTSDTKERVKKTASVSTLVNLFTDQ